MGENNMNISLFLKILGLCIAAALIIFVVYGTDLFFLVKTMALAIGLSIIINVFYPFIRKIKKGDRVLIVGNDIPFFSLGRKGFALNNSELNKEIRVKLDDGREAVGIVESYEGMFSSPKIRIIYEENIVE